MIIEKAFATRTERLKIIISFNFKVVVDTEVVAMVVAAVENIKQLPFAANVEKFIEMPNLSSTITSTVMMLIMITFNCDL